MTTGNDHNTVQSDVSRIVWPWMEALGKPTATPSCRKRAIIQFLCMLIVTGLLSLKHPHMALTVLCVACYVIITGLVFPGLFLATERVFKIFGHWVGIALTWMLLVPFFLLVFLPGRLVLLASHRDPLTRDFPGKGRTNWRPHVVYEGRNHYRKQY
jgi:hypothetical protein